LSLRRARVLREQRRNNGDAEVVTMGSQKREHDPTLKFLVALEQGTISSQKFNELARNTDVYIAELI
jgi:hypothetical protein